MPQRTDAAAPSPRRTRSQRLWESRAVKLLTWASSLAIFTALLLGITIGLPRLQARLAASLAESPRRIQIDWPALADSRPTNDPSATWVPPEVRDDLTALVQRFLDQEPDPFNARSLVAISGALRDTGWFERIIAVRRERDRAGDPILHIEAAWRTPAAVVRRNSVDYLISWDARVLPIAYPLGSSNQRAILGIAQDAPRSAGEIVRGELWPGEDLRAALDTLRLIASKPWAGQIASIDASEYAARKRLTLITARQSRIVWGGAPEDAVPGEVGATVKLARLDALAARYEGKIDANERVVEIAGPVTLVDKSASAEALAVGRPR